MLINITSEPAVRSHFSLLFYKHMQARAKKNISRRRRCSSLTLEVTQKGNKDEKNQASFNQHNSHQLAAAMIYDNRGRKDHK